MANNIHEAVFNGTNAEARGEMLYGSMLAGMAFANAPTGAIHALAYPVALYWGVSHGLSNSLLMPAVLKYNAPVANNLYAEIAPCMFPELKGTDAQVCDAWIDKMEGMCTEFGIPNRLSSVGITKDDLDFLMVEGMKQKRLLPNNPRLVEPEDARGIYASII